MDSPSLTPSSLLCEACEFFRVGSDVDSCCIGFFMILKCALTSFGREFLLSRVCVFRFAIRLPLLVSTIS